MPHFTICPPDPRIENPPLYEYAHDHTDTLTQDWAACPLCESRSSEPEEPLCAKDLAAVNRLFPRSKEKALPRREDARVCQGCREDLPF